MTQPDGKPESLAAALAVLQTRLPVIAKGQTATVRSEKGVYTYDYADLADVSEAILPLLGALGMAWTCKPTMNEAGRFVLAFKLLHVSGEYEAGEYPLKEGGMPQGTGSAISYARRYALCAVTGAAPKGDDDDAAAAAATPKPRQAQRKTAAGRPQADPGADAPQKSGRTAQRATQPQGGPPLPHEAAGRPGGEAPISGPQRGMVLALFGKAGIEDRDERLEVSRRIVGRPGLGSANELTSREASKLIDVLQAAAGLEDMFDSLDVADRADWLALASLYVSRPVPSLMQLTPSELETVRVALETIVTQDAEGRAADLARDLQEARQLAAERDPQ